MQKLISINQFVILMMFLFYFILFTSCGLSHPGRNKFWAADVCVCDPLCPHCVLLSNRCCLSQSYMSGGSLHVYFITSSVAKVFFPWSLDTVQGSDICYSFVWIHTSILHNICVNVCICVCCYNVNIYTYIQV